MKTDGLFVITCIIFIFLAWVATGGPSRPIATAGPYITPVTKPGETSQGYRGTAPANSVQNSAYPTQVAGGTSGATNLYSYSRSGVAGQPRSGANGRTSTVHGLVTFQHLPQGPLMQNASQEYVVVTAGGTTDSSISGYTLVSTKTGKRIRIPNGTETVRSGAVNTASPITLHPGDMAYIATGASPVGVSFRENSCTGYLGQFQSYTPPLTQSCPLPSTEVARFYTGGDGACVAFVSSVPRCTFVSSVPSSLPSSCVSFIQQHLSYNGCVATHERDASFATPLWRVYLGQSTELWGSSPETITLLDQNGSVVDSYSY